MVKRLNAAPANAALGSSGRESLAACLLARAFSARSHFYVARFEFAVPLPDLLFDLFGDQIDRGIEIVFDVFGKKVGPRKGDSHRTRELALSGLGFVVFERYAGGRSKLVQVFQLPDPVHKVIFDGLGKAEIVRRKDQVHAAMMESRSDKIQRNIKSALGFEPESGPTDQD